MGVPYALAVSAFAIFVTDEDFEETFLCADEGIEPYDLADHFSDKYSKDCPDLQVEWMPGHGHIIALKGTVSRAMADNFGDMQVTKVAESSRSPRIDGYLAFLKQVKTLFKSPDTMSWAALHPTWKLWSYCGGPC